MVERSNSIKCIVVVQATFGPSAKGELCYTRCNSLGKIGMKHCENLDELAEGLLCLKGSSLDESDE